MKKREGFNKQILITVPPDMFKKRTALTDLLYLTDIGYFPRAGNHYVKRPGGCSSNILIICRNGEGWFDTGGGEKKVRTGEACIIPSDTSHSYGSTENRWWEIYWLHFQGVHARNICLHLADGNTGSAFSCRMTDESRALFSQICSSLSGECNPVKYELICSRLWNLTGSLYSDSRKQSASTSTVISECISVMEEKLRSSLSLSELSDRLSISAPYLCRLFRSETGHSPMEHYIHMKVSHACNLLDMTSSPVGEISRMIGIDDPYYFSRMFKRVMGVSPRTFRKRQK